MKKTRITMAALFALCSTGMAWGVELSDAVYSSTSFNTNKVDLSTYEISGDFSVTLTLDADKVMSLIGSGTPTTETLTQVFTLDGATSGYTGFVMGNPENNTSHNGFFVAYTEKAAVGGTVPQGSRYAFTDVQASSLSYMSAVDLSDATDFAVTLTFDRDGDVSGYLSYDVEGTTTTWSGSRLRTNDIQGNLSMLAMNTDLVTSVYVFGSALSATDAASVNVAAASVPEPTTATLSLLALAGLAARRK